MSICRHTLSYVKNSIKNILIRLFCSSKLPQKKYYLSVCAIFKNEGKFLTEWINYHLLAGVEHFYLYNNFSQDNYKEILQPYIDNNLVTLTEFPVKHGQSQAYQNCVENYASETNWIAFIDLDEYAVPLKGKDLKSCLKKYSKFPAISFPWYMFSSSGIIHENTNKLICEQFTLGHYHAASMKSFLNTKWAEKITSYKSPHFFRFKIFNKVFPENTAFFSKIKNKPQQPSIQINHYYNKSFDYFRNKKIADGSLDPQGYISFDTFFKEEEESNEANYLIFKFLIQLKLFNLNEFLAQK